MLGLIFNLLVGCLAVAWCPFWCFCRGGVGGRGGRSWSRVGGLGRVVRVSVRWVDGWSSAGGYETRGGLGRGSAGRVGWLVSPRVGVGPGSGSGLVVAGCER